MIPMALTKETKKSAPLLKIKTVAIVPFTQSHREPWHIKRCSRILWHLIHGIKAYITANISKLWQAPARSCPMALPFPLPSVAQGPGPMHSQVSTGSCVRGLGSKGCLEAVVFL